MNDLEKNENTRETTQSLLEALQKLNDAGVLSDDEFHLKIHEVRNRYRKQTSKALQGTERRKTPRKQVRYFLSVLNRTTQVQIGLLVDITREGAMIIREAPLAVEKVYPLRILFPEPIDEFHCLDIDGRTTWSEEDIHPGFFATGIKFTEVSEENEHLIRRLINQFGVMSMDQPRL
jgi:hypothetical protein